MPTPEEEKIIICGAEINYRVANSVKNCADAMLETYNLFVQTVKRFGDRDAEYFAKVRDKANEIKRLAIEIQESAREQTRRHD